MADTFRALVVTRTDDGNKAEIADFAESDLMEGDVTVAVSHSTVNYKDGLAVTGTAPILRASPMIPGIDFAGEVIASDHADWKPGDKVLLNGYGVGEGHHGGFAAKARVKGDWLVKLPDAFSTADAMAIGTAGYTAMLCVLALEKHGLGPKDGDILVTGANGGVGSVAIALLAKLGYSVIASTGRTNEADYLKQLGASDVMDRKELSGTRTAHRQGALGGRGGCGGRRDAGKRHCADEVRRHGGRLRACRRRRPAVERLSLHPARHHAGGHRQRHGAACHPRGSLDAPCPRPRHGQAQRHDRHYRSFGCAAGGV